jgi:UPF0042 nucleotide-binding protein
LRVVLITGISGSGKSIALNVLEDDGFYCVDNLPVRFLPDLITLLSGSGQERVAVAIDARSGESVYELRHQVGQLSARGHDVKTIFLNASTPSLVQRYAETRRRHPMSLPAPGDDEHATLVEAISREREVMSVLQDLGLTLDTSDLHPNVLRQWVRDVVGAERAPVTLLFESFAYKEGVPLDADLAFDARCLPNPHYSPDLRPLSGLDEPVDAYLRQIPSVVRFVDQIAAFLHTWLPFYIQEHRSYLTVAIGCTGGQHRSVWCAQELANRFRRTEHVLVRHRGLAQRRAAGS